jgi:hypothetical protein
VPSWDYSCVMARSQRGRGTGSIRKLPSSRWQARVLQDRQYVALGSFIQKADANAALRDAFGRQDETTWVDPRQGRVPFASYADDWVTGRHDLAMRTKQDYEALPWPHLEPASGPPRWLTFSHLHLPLVGSSQRTGRARASTQVAPPSPDNPQRCRSRRPDPPQPLPHQGPVPTTRQSG